MKRRQQVSAVPKGTGDDMSAIPQRVRIHRYFRRRGRSAFPVANYSPRSWAERVISSITCSSVYQSLFSTARAIRVRVRSIVFHWRLRREALRNLAFDQHYGTDTAAEVPLALAGVNATDAERGNGAYRAVWASEFHRSMAALPIEHDRFVFIDFGSGKGKAMLMAADYSFRRIIGVEYAPRLHQIAVRNIAVYREMVPGCCPCEPILCDALTYVPPDEPLVCFFFNPFDDATLGQVFHNLRLSVQRHYRDVYIIYVNLRTVWESHYVFDDLDDFVLVRRDRKYLIYKLPG